MTNFNEMDLHCFLSVSLLQIHTYIYIYVMHQYVCTLLMKMALILQNKNVFFQVNYLCGGYINHKV